MGQHQPECNADWPSDRAQQAGNRQAEPWLGHGMF